MSDLDLLRDLGPRLRQPEFDEILDARRLRTRRHWLVAATAAAATVVVVALTVPGPATRSDVPPVDRTPTLTPTPSPDLSVPTGQRTIEPHVARRDLHGYEVLATVTNSQPAHRGAAELTAVVPDTRQFASTYCRGPEDVYYFIDIGDGSQGYDRCSPDSLTTLEPDVDIGDLFYREPVQSPQTIRMWVARPSASWLACMHDGRGDCTIDEIEPLAGADVLFGFEVYAHEPTLAFQLLADGGNGEPWPIQALATRDGKGWLVDRAVTASPGADRLVIEVPATDHATLLDVYSGPGRHFERCRTQHDELPDPATTDSLEYAKALDRACGTTLRLSVDGEVVEPTDDPAREGHFQPLGGTYWTGSQHDIVVEVVRGDPRDVAYAVVLRVPTKIP